MSECLTGLLTTAPVFVGPVKIGVTLTPALSLPSRQN